MSNNYNFDEVTNDEPTIQMAGVEYRMRYPTVEEIEKLESLKTDLERTNAILSFVYPVKEGDKPFPEAIKKQSIKVLQSFTDMVKTEFGLQG